MARCYRRLQYDERCQIRAFHKRGVSVSEIVRQLGRDVATVSRELHRNRGVGGYRHKRAQRLAERRRSAASSGPRKLTPAVWAIVRALLLQQWSPEQTAGRLARVSLSWLYKRIHQDRESGGKLYVFLRQGGRKRRRKPTPGTAGRGCIPARADIAGAPRDRGRAAAHW